jgi:hypothetical protein
MEEGPAGIKNPASGKFKRQKTFLPAWADNFPKVGLVFGYLLLQ